MIPRIPERKKQPGLHYAVTEEGVELPILDLTHPRFSADMDASRWAEKQAAHLAQMQRHARVPRLVKRLLFALYRRRSVLFQGLIGAQGTFLGGLHTYLMKLGADNLGHGYASRIDRGIAGSFPAWMARLRTFDMARALAGMIAPRLASHPGRALHLVNIAGGPASDSLNALLRLRREQPALLDSRSIVLHVLDLHREAPAFGHRSLRVLMEEGGPLHGLEIAFEDRPYDWNHPAVLADLLGSLPSDALVVGTSEGGLLQYGSDEAITGNLEVFYRRTPADAVMIGSVTWDSPFERLSRQMFPLAVRAFTPEALDRLIAQTGWVPEEPHRNPESQVIRLVKQPGGHPGGGEA